MDNDLAVQIPYVRRVCEVFRMPIVELPGFEADDVIATLARQAVERGMKVIVVSGDKDLLQLVSEDVLVLNPGREGTGATLYDRGKVEEKFGVPPERFVDVLALVGDAVDNIPGVAGIGDKGARDLVREFGPVEAVLENADKVKRAAYREGLKTHREEALLSKHLVTLRTRRSRHARSVEARSAGAGPAGGARALQGAGVPGPGPRVRARVRDHRHRAARDHEAGRAGGPRRGGEAGGPGLAGLSS